MVPITCHSDCVCYINEILDCYYKLSQLPDLEPSLSVNCLFERLVHLCSQIPSEAVTTQVRHTEDRPQIVSYMNKLDSIRSQNC